MMSVSTVVVAEEEAAKASYKGFGSFHSDNVEDLIRVPDTQYQPPQYPPFVHPFAALSRFGEGVRESHFCISSDFTFANQGAFGGALKEAMQLKSDFALNMESQLLTFYDRHLLPWMVHSTRSVARFLNCPNEEVVLVPNATYGVNAAMSLIGAGDVVAYLDSEYGSVYKMLWFRAKACGATLHEIPVHALIHSSTLADDAQFTSYIAEKLPSDCTTFVIDHITSSSAFEYPIFTHLIPMLRSRGVQKIIVDGAHGPMQTVLDINGLPPTSRPTVYVGNFHKWMACPKSVGFMWLETASHGSITPPVRSHGANEGFTSEFIFDGTRDYTASLCVPMILDFWRAVGFDRVRSYCRDLLQTAEKMMTSAFEVPCVARHAPFMTLVRLPDNLNRGVRPTAKYVQDILHERFRIEVPVKTVEGALYLRLSAFVYNTLSDYERIRDAVLLIAEEWKKRPRDANGSQSVNGDCPDAANADGDGGCGAGGLGKPRKRTRGF